MIPYESVWIIVTLGLCRACTYIDHGSYYKGSSSTLLYSASGTVEFCKTECSSNPSCNGFGRMSGNCYFSTLSVPLSTTCSGCSFYTKDNCDTTSTTTTTTVTPTTSSPTTTEKASTTPESEPTTTETAATTTQSPPTTVTGVQKTTEVVTKQKNATQKGTCGCPCFVNTTAVKKPVEKPESLVISKKDLFSYRNARICIADNRPSAVALGALGVTILVACALLVVLPDVFRLMRVIWNRDCLVQKSLKSI